MRDLWHRLLSELVKARRRPLYRVLLAVALCLGVFPLAMAFNAWRDPKSLSMAAGFLSWPGCLLMALLPLLPLSRLLVAVLVGGMVGEEYSAGTWKMTLPRARRRSTSLFAKWLAGLLLACAGLLCALAFSLACSAVGARLLGVPFASGAPTPGKLGLTALFLLLDASLTVSLALLATVATRSQLGGALAGALGPTFLRQATFLPYGWLLPATHLDYLESQWLVQTSLKAADVIAQLQHPTTVAWSAAAVLAACAVCVAIAAAIFERRDLASA